MKNQLFILSTFTLVLISCSNNKEKKAKPDSSNVFPVIKVAVKPASVPSVEKHTDTLQFIHYDDNFDYWYALFLNAKNDTVKLVTDKALSETVRDKMLEVQWKTDTLEEAGDNDAKYAAKRLLNYKQITVPVYVKPINEERVIKDISDLAEIKSEDARVGISNKPTFEKPYFGVETSTENEDNRSRLFSFRVYTYPFYEIRYYDLANDKELSLQQWRKSK